MKMSKGVVIFAIIAILFGVFGVIDGIPTLKMMLTDSEALAKEISERGVSKLYYYYTFVTNIVIISMFLLAGIGILFRKNCARKLIIIAALFSLLNGGCNTIHSFISFRERGLLTGTMIALQIYMYVFSVIINGSFIFFFTRRNVRNQFIGNAIERSNG